MAMVAWPFGAVALSASDRKMPLPLPLEPEPRTPNVPMVLLLSVPLKEVATVEPAMGAPICNVMALPLAPVIVLLEALKVVLLNPAKVRLLPPMLLFAWLLLMVLFWKIVSIATLCVAVGSTPVKLAALPGEPTNVLPVTVELTVELPLAARRATTVRAALACGVPIKL